MSFQDISYRLVADGVAQVSHSPCDTVIAPQTVLLSHPDDKGFQLCIDQRAARHLALLGTIELLGNQPARPRKDGVWFDDGSDLFQGLLAELFTNLREGLPLPIAQPDAALNLLAQKAILRHQVFVAQQEFLID
jgi:hypothetical protein